MCWHDDMVCFAHTGTCGFPTEVDVSDKTILARYSNNWGNLAENETQVGSVGYCSPPTSSTRI